MMIKLLLCIFLTLIVVASGILTIAQNKATGYVTVTESDSLPPLSIYECWVDGTKATITKNETTITFLPPFTNVNNITISCFGSFEGPTGTIYVNITTQPYNLVLSPVIISVSPHPLPTNSIEVNITGYYFHDNAKVFQGTSHYQSGLLLSGNSYLFTTDNNVVYEYPSFQVVGNTEINTSLSFPFSYANPSFEPSILVDSYLDQHAYFVITNSGLNKSLITITTEDDQAIEIVSIGQLQNSNKYQVDIKIPRGMKNGQITVDCSFSSDCNELINIKPIITGVSSEPIENENSTITINGFYFGNTIFSLTQLGQTETTYNLTCKPVGNFFESVSCEIPSGNGTFELYTANYNEPITYSSIVQFNYTKGEPKSSESSEQVPSSLSKTNVNILILILFNLILLIL